MTRNRIIVGVVAALLLLTGFWYYKGADAKEGSSYRTAQVERGDVEQSVSSTGTLGAVQTVQVGTQVSGKVIELFADFNDRVKKGQLIARIDPTLQQQAVRDAEASLERTRAELDRAQQEYNRNATLFEQKVITETEFNTVKYNLAVARAGVKSGEVSLERARQNLAYTDIYAPIDGIVVERNVEPGQTVAASLSAPQLFLLANDLSHLRILASVDESDIGSIKEGMPVHFTVQAYPDQTFEGVVQQVRLQSTTTENVVNYTAVVDVANPTGKLLPGMTASVNFQVENAKNALKVPNAALRLRPTDEMLLAVGEKPQAGDSQRAGGAQGGQGGQAGANRQGGQGGGFGGGGFGGPGGGQARAPRAAGARPGAPARLWYLDDAGKLHVTRVRTGITDGKETVVMGPELKEGMKVVTGINGGAAATGTTNPFQQGGPGGPGGPPRGGPGGF